MKRDAARTAELEQALAEAAYLRKRLGIRIEQVNEARAALEMWEAAVSEEDAAEQCGWWRKFEDAARTFLDRIRTPEAP